MSQITYADKVALNPQPSVADINKVTDNDMNMIKDAHNDTDNKVTEILDLQYCVATISSSQTASSNYRVLLNSITSTDNNMFSLNNGNIIIGQNVNTIRISASIFIQDLPANNYVWGKLILNDSNNQAKQVITSISNGFGNGPAYTSVVISERILEVQQGDIISLMTDGPLGGTIRSNYDNTWVQIEKIN